MFAPESVIDFVSYEKTVDGIDFVVPGLDPALVGKNRHYHEVCSGCCDFNQHYDYSHRTNGHQPDQWFADALANDIEPQP